MLMLSDKIILEVLSHLKSFITLLGHGVPSTFYMRDSDLLPKNITASE